MSNLGIIEAIVSFSPSTGGKWPRFSLQFDVGINIALQVAELGSDGFNRLFEPPASSF